MEKIKIILCVTSLLSLVAFNTTLTDNNRDLTNLSLDQLESIAFEESSGPYHPDWSPWTETYDCGCGGTFQVEECRQYSGPTCYPDDYPWDPC